MKISNKYMGGGTTYNGPFLITPGTEGIIIPKNTIIKELYKSII